MAESKRGSSKGSSSKTSSSKTSSSKRSSSKRGSSTSTRASSTRSSSDGPSARDFAMEAARQLQELTGRPVEGITGMEKNGSEWTVTLEVLELERVPNTTDILGRYEVTLDRNGELTGAQRTRRYPRAEAGED